MKRTKYSSILPILWAALALIFSASTGGTLAFLLYPGSGLCCQDIAFFGGALMSIPLVGMGTNPYPDLGRTAEHHPAEMIRSKVGSGIIRFGKALVRGAVANSAKVIGAASDIFVGIATYSTQASDLDNERYLDGDPVGVMDVGVPCVFTEEAVDESSPVRVRFTSEAKTAGYQMINFTSAITGASATGLANDATVYNETVIINGVDQPVAVTGSAAQTIAALIAEINADLEGAALSIIAGNLQLASLFPGDDSSVDIVAGGTLFSVLTNFSALAASVAGSSDPDPNVEAGNFRTTADAGKTARLTNVEFAGSTTGPGIVPLYVKPGAHDLIAD
jgi:hypothetical protein